MNAKLKVLILIGLIFSCPFTVLGGGKSPSDRQDEFLKEHECILDENTCQNVGEIHISEAGFYSGICCNQSSAPGEIKVIVENKDYGNSQKKKGDSSNGWIEVFEMIGRSAAAIIPPLGLLFGGFFAYKAVKAYGDIQEIVKAGDLAKETIKSAEKKLVEFNKVSYQTLNQILDAEIEIFKENPDSNYIQKFFLSKDRNHMRHHKWAGERLSTALLNLSAVGSVEDVELFDSIIADKELDSETHQRAIECRKILCENLGIEGS